MCNYSTMKPRDGCGKLSIMGYSYTTHRCPLGLWVDQSVTPFSQQLRHLSAFKDFVKSPTRGHLCHLRWTMKVCSQQEHNVSPMMRSNQMLMSRFGSAVLLPSFGFHPSPTGTFRTHQLKQHGHIFKEANRKNKYGYLESCGRGKS